MRWGTWQGRGVVVESCSEGLPRCWLHTGARSWWQKGPGTVWPRRWFREERGVGSGQVPRPQAAYPGSHSSQSKAAEPLMPVTKRRWRQSLTCTHSVTCTTPSPAPTPSALFYGCCGGSSHGRLWGHPRTPLAVSPSCQRKGLTLQPLSSPLCAGGSPGSRDPSSPSLWWGGSREGADFRSGQWEGN